ncbi:hypothetical protein VTL71DRAFT_11768 [Oculimacula yallundae]|uniref:Uncharacterized protein n=1 Tax=Oculimacula yallundae TaxID=86028 RepID=A0ABR4CR63_9HELO
MSSSNSASDIKPTDAPLDERMAQPTGGSIQPIQVTEQEKKAVKDNDHHGTRSSMGEKISNALDFPGLNTKPPPAQTRKGL